MAKDPNGITYTITTDQPRIGDSFYYELSQPIDVVHYIRKSNKVLYVTGANIELINIGTCRLAFPILELVDPKTITDNNELYYNFGKRVYIRLEGLYFRYTVGTGWEQIQKGETPGSWAFMLDEQKKVFVQRLKETQLI